MKTEHLKLYLSGARPEDTVKAIQDEIIEKTTKQLESTKDPEDLLKERKTLRVQREQLQAQIKRQKTVITKSNKQREQMLAQWLSFKVGYAELARKHGIDFETFPAHLTHGRTFNQKLQNINPNSFVMVEGLRIPSNRTDAILDDDKIKLFEVEAKQVLLEEIISRKHKAMKELFSSDLE